VACLTNKPTAFARPLLAAKGLDGFFTHVFGGDAFERKKPDPLPLLKTCEALGTAPAHTLMVGDSGNDAQAARAAGCPVVLVRYGYNHGQPVEAAGADALVDRLDLASLDVGNAFGGAADRELGNGLTNVVAIWVAVLPAGGAPPALVYGRIIDILFDVWEETYVVTVKDPRAPQGLRLVLRDARALPAGAPRAPAWSPPRSAMPRGVRSRAAWRPGAPPACRWPC